MRSRFSHFIVLSSESDPEKSRGSNVPAPRWRWLLNLGIAFLLGGLLAITLPQFVTTALNVLFGFLLLLIGLATGLYAFQARHFSRDRWPVMTSLALIICGLLLLVFPKFGAVSITVIIAVFFIFSGMGKIALAQLIPPQASRLWISFSGFVDLILSFLIFFNLSTTSGWLLGLLLGISLILQGWWNIRLALSLRKSLAHVFDAQ